MQYNNLHVFNWLWASFQNLHFLHLSSKHKLQQFALQSDALKNSFNYIRISSCLSDMIGSSCFEKNNDISCHNSYFVQRLYFMSWYSFIISWFMQRISNCIIFIFMLRLFRSFLSHQHDQTFVWWFVRICRHINDRSHMILINFFIMNSCINIFDSIFLLMNISFMISIALKFVNFNFLTNSFSNICNWVSKSLFHLYSLSDFDRFLYEYDVFDLMKACWIVSLICFIFMSVLSDAVSFKTFCNSSMFSIR